MRFKPAIGQVLFSLNVGYGARNKPAVLTRVVVCKVGRKYFTCEGETEYFRETQYDIATWRENCDQCNVTSQLYASEQERADEVEHAGLCRYIQAAFTMQGYMPASHAGRGYKLPLETLRQIKALIPSHDPEPV